MKSPDKCNRFRGSIAVIRDLVPDVRSMLNNRYVCEVYGLIVCLAIEGSQAHIHVPRYQE